MSLVKQIFKILKWQILLIIGTLFCSSVFVPIIFNLYVLEYYSNLFNYFSSLQSLTNNGQIFNDSIVLSKINNIIDKEIIINLIYFFSGFVLLQSMHFIGGLFTSFSLPIINKKLKQFALFHTLKFNLSFFQEKNSGDIEKNITNFADSFCQMIELSLLFASHITQILLSLYFCFKVKMIFIIFVIWMVSICLVGFFLFRLLNTKSSEKTVYQNDQSGFINEVLNNILLFKIFKCNQYINFHFNNKQKKENSAYKQFLFINASNKFIIGMSNIFFLCVSVLLICKLYVKYPGLNITFFFIQFWQATKAYWDIMWNALPMFNQGGRFLNSYKFMKINDILEVKEIEITSFKNINIQNLNFFYKKANIINNFSCEIQNMLVTIEGPSGGGKSTLLNLISGTIPSSTGTIFINNKDINDISNFNDFLTFLPQQDLIFNDTIINNITLGRTYNKEKFNALIEMTQLSSIFSTEEMGKHFCGVNGTQISGGQAKRICFCRTMLFDNSDKLIILDEPFNNLDNKLIEILLNYFKQFKNKRTIICVDHTESFKTISDKLITVDIEHYI